MIVSYSMIKPIALIAFALLLSSCSHTPLRPFDCQAIFSLRLGQSPDEVRALLGRPVDEGAEQHLWETKQVVDYVMRFEDQKAAWIAGSSDVFWVEFLNRKLVRATAFRVDSSEAYAENVGLALGSASFGQPSPSNNNRPAPVEAHIGPAFSKIFQCSTEGELANARTAFEGQITR
jgi:hypothetical protein